ncbi:MurR/RpiR family transcriptional regulator [Sulfitobacter sp. PS-8MA]|uniref:MurR/RpiR family transcriptional regulator n=1 Tax=Sulfitobacter sp. PS-8MA TaxID=3237707 RepID=UPI0034C5DF45
MTKPPQPPEVGARDRIKTARNLSKAESEVALWVERNFDNLPFETAADLAVGAGVSEMTISRFVRRLGYKNFKAFKAAVHAEFRRPEADTKSQRSRRLALPAGTALELDEQLQLEVEAIKGVYQLATTDQWQAALDCAQAAEHVNIVGLQAVKGMAMDFATRLKYVRPGVRFADGRSGSWSELFLETPQKSCVILIEVLPYAREAVKIAELCLRRDIPLIMVTDRYSAWPRQYTPHVLAVTTFTKAYLDSTAGLSALLGLFLNGITTRVGEPAAKRMREMRDLADHFDPFIYEPSRQMRPVTDISSKGDAE